MRKSAVALVATLTACAAKQPAPRIGEPVAIQRTTEHRGDDDLLTAGLGLDGLRSAKAPAFADPAQPNASEARRRAIWSSWRGIADLTPNGGYGELYGSAVSVPGRELSALATLPGATQPHRIVLQVPDNFDRARRCLVVAPSSGSRGVYGAIAVAGAWALPRGCAVVYTDKGTGSDYFDLDSETGVRLDGTRGARAEAAAFTPEAGGTGVAVKHAHSRDNPEASWGKHVLQAVEFALGALTQVYPEEAAFDFASTRVIAVGISNGGGAVLRASEVEGDWLDGVVAGEPNVNAPDGRALYDYTTLAALLSPCALLHFPATSVPRGPFEPMWTARCNALGEAGLVHGDTVAAKADSAYTGLHDAGFTDEALLAGAVVTAFDLWRAIAVTYASAYSRTGVADQPCDYHFAAVGQDGKPRAATDAERGAWFSEGSGIPPGQGVAIVDSKAAGGDPAFAGLMCLRDLAKSDTVRASIGETVAALPQKTLPIMVVHGIEDGLIPEAFSSQPYVKGAQDAGRVVSHWRVEHAQHFDAFLALPGYSDRYVPLLPYVYAALDKLWEHLDGKASMPPDALISTKPRGAEAATLEQLSLPR